VYPSPRVGYYPYGTPIFIDTHLPSVQQNQIIKGQPFRHLMIAQDTGGAIKGPVRGDIFWGDGKNAEWLAGHMQSDGSAWVLLPRGLLKSYIKAF
jgi:membrane-bound lytic murein transglycosylase A